ncbi:TetR/AcrR family transcriptional regulator [Streptomyces noursei]|uniref:TetR family transcriptional regulator n=2 Tax=Streptomyces TaxID=1883 RepID=A0A2N8P4Y3_STRNR|nr:MULTISPECIES: TetR/AcrR family transcriptional regulator [Streptomyces]ANZ17041.1 transcriptional regulator, TetR family [Streptomyces noursei ATCC 11455]MCZ0994008.1 TetR/AcrR family transcriptional regulator [Streptomyces noursei]MCZ1017311.1 TetR/AcrR family transcriptional regulator [Streptomyces noursei]PNE36083.1 TetR family transcriptional regulator [Streptomyces noursei]QRX93635.1 TetR/AcrR family transcriptional regulator [Streptomyces noursei]
MSEEKGGGKPQLTRQGSLRRTSLLDAAETVLVAKGNADASLRAIAGEAGVRVGHLQHYFPTRADLIKAVLERALDRSLERLAETTGLRLDREDPSAIEVPEGGRAEPAEVVAVVLAEQDDPQLVRLYVEVWALAARDDEIAAVVREFYQKYVAHVEAFVQQGRPEWSAGFCRARAETFVALVEGAALMRSGIAGSRSGAMDQQLAQQAVQLLRD